MSGGLMSCGLKSGGLISGGLKSAHRCNTRHIMQGWASRCKAQHYEC